MSLTAFDLWTYRRHTTDGSIDWIASPVRLEDGEDEQHHCIVIPGTWADAMATAVAGRRWVGKASKDPR